jgi:hypothetical protein
LIIIIIFIVRSPHRIRAAAVDFPLITKRVREYTPSKVVSVDDIAYPSTFL